MCINLVAKKNEQAPVSGSAGAVAAEAGAAGAGVAAASG